MMCYAASSSYELTKFHAAGTVDMKQYGIVQYTYKQRLCVPSIHSPKQSVPYCTAMLDFLEFATQQIFHQVQLSSL
jgi:hypothetical protein